MGKKEIFCPRCGAKQPREPKERIDRITGIKSVCFRVIPWLSL